MLPRFSHVYIECSFVELYAGQALAAEVIDHLSDHGFDLRGVYNVQYDPQGWALQADLLFAAQSIANVSIVGAVLDSLLQATNSALVAQPRGGFTDVRPGLAIIANVMTPYRANLHRLVAAGIPELKLHTLVTHGVGDFDWSVAVPPEINTTNFSTVGEHSLDNPLRRPIGEFRKAGRLIEYLKTHEVKAVVFCFYRYLSYLRVMDYCYRAEIPFWVNLDSNIRSEPHLSGLQSFVKRKLYDWWLKRASGAIPCHQLVQLRLASPRRWTTSPAR